MEQESNLIQHMGKGATAALAAALLSVSSIPAAAIATEFDVMNSSTPSFNYLIDDAGVLNKTTKKSVNDKLYKLEASCAFHWSQPCFAIQLLLLTICYIS